MNYAEIKKYDISNGTGVRTSLFVSGCTHHCKNCFNQETWDFEYGKTFSDDTINEIIDSLKYKYIQGLTLIGGDPLMDNNIPDCLRLVKEVRKTYGSTKDIWCYTGYTLEELLNDNKKTPELMELLHSIDILVDGPFVEEKKDLSLKFRGSSNQRIIDLTKVFI